ncbi:HlyD family secretion protein [Rhodopila sp.]|uniref:HlyD family secretion protein n=1 Tax=Rhodopila sp. TaxID=2480087 RepID=UPI003D0BA4B4
MSDVKMDAPTDKNKHRSEPKGSDKGKDDKKDEQKPLPWWPFVLAGVVVAGFVGVVLWIVFAPQPDVWTDDAYVMVHYATISPRISGQVASVDVADNQVVKAGQVLVTLDPRDDQTTLESAKAALERDTAQVNNAAANVARQPSLITEQEAEVASAQARLSFAQSDQRRYGNLAATGAGTAQQRQQADTTLRQDQMSLQSAQAALDASRRQMDVLKAQKSAQEGTVKADQARIDQANLNLSYTRILAPQDGMVGEKTVDVGNNVSPGATLMTVVPLDLVYIEANYREVDLRHVRGGQHVTIHVDAYDIDLDGVVDSVPPATGATFSPIPPNNATGNFTKIVQRLPVKILISPNQPLARLLRVGFSVETTIHTGLENVVGEQDNAAARVTAH